MGATSPPLVLDVGAYCGGSALRLAGCLPGAPLFPVYRPGVSLNGGTPKTS